MVYDKVTFYLDMLPRGYDPQRACVHIALYLCWIVGRGFHCPDLESDEELAGLLRRLKRRAIPPAEFCMTLGGVLGDAFLNDEGRAFTRYYYNNKNLYLIDYPRTLLVKPMRRLFDVEGTWEQADRMGKVIDRRYDEWIRKGRPRYPYSSFCLLRWLEKAVGN